MWNLFWPIAVIVAANTLYNLCTKAAPAGANAFALLFLTYLTAAAASLALLFLTGRGSVLPELGKANGTSLALGLAIVGLEFGYVAAYRAGWKVSTCSLTANITLACVLLAVGRLLYREQVSPRQLLGAAVCGLGLFLIGGRG